MKQKIILVTVLIFTSMVTAISQIDDGSVISIGVNEVKSVNLNPSAYNLELQFQSFLQSDRKNVFYGVHTSIGFSKKYKHLPGGFLLGVPILIASIVRQKIDIGKTTKDDELLILIGLYISFQEGVAFRYLPFNNLSLTMTLSPLRFSKLRDGHYKENRFFLSGAFSTALKYKVSKLEFGIESELAQLYAKRSPILTVGFSAGYFLF